MLIIKDNPVIETKILVCLLRSYEVHISPYSFLVVTDISNIFLACVLHFELPLQLFLNMNLINFVVFIDTEKWACIFSAH